MHKSKQKIYFHLITVVVALVLLLLIITIMIQQFSNNHTTVSPTDLVEKDINIDAVQPLNEELSDGLTVDDIGSYSGLYIEDGTDEIISGILMLTVTNHAEQTMQYAEITLSDGVDTAYFSLTTLPPGESAVLLEKNRMTYKQGMLLKDISLGTVSYFTTEPSMCESLVTIQKLDGVLNITNISGTPITGDIMIYYKNASEDMLYGGITYRVTISGGLETDEIRQITANHFYAKGSRIMFVTVG